jgi:outer membrane receptor protein involved in Fe transport
MGVVFSATGKDQKILPNAPFHLHKPYETVDARLAYTNVDQGWSIELAGKNLTNEHIFMNSTLQGGALSSVRWYQPGTTWSLKFGFKY